MRVRTNNAGDLTSINEDAPTEEARSVGVAATGSALGEYKE